MRFFQRLGVAALVSSQTAFAFKATILADTNRDGKVDIKGETDSKDKATWTLERGAIFLANVGDSGQRCSLLIKDETLDEEVDDCHDSSDNIQRNSKYLAPLRTLPIPKLSHSAKGSVFVVGESNAEKVRIFNNDGKDWNYVSDNYTFTAEELSAGLELGIDSRDVRRDDWNGRITVKFTVEDGKETSEDNVAFRVAPVLTHHHAQKAERVFVSGSDYDDAQKQFVTDLKKNVAGTGHKAPVYTFKDVDIWTQDFFETAYTSMPGPDGPIILRVLVRSAQINRFSGRQIFSHLRSDSVGAIQTDDAGGSTDSTGNLETIPPYTANGVSYPAGRIILGSQGGKVPLITPFFKAQEMQTPLELDTDWLTVGHVDEFLQFLPAKTKRGWALIADDPMAGLRLLQKAVADGHGDNMALSRPIFPSDPDQCIPSNTINQVLSRDNFTGANEFAAREIEKNLQILKKETGITDAEIFRVPALFHNKDWACDLSGSKVLDRFEKKSVVVEKTSKKLSILDAVPHTEEHSKRMIDVRDQVFAFYPGTVNGLVLSDNHIISPNPWGPKINGKDILAAAVKDVYSRASMNITFQDDWFSHHTGMGEIHCGTNSWREANKPWW